MNVNVIANIFGRFGSIFLSLFFVPLFVGLLGYDVFGLIVIYTTIQMIFSLLEGGVGPAINRLTANREAGIISDEDYSVIFATAEKFILSVSVFLLLLSPFFGFFFGKYWLTSEGVAPGTLAIVVSMMLGATAIRLTSLIYFSVLAGARRQVTMNVIQISGAVIRTAGAYGVLVCIDATAIAYFMVMIVESVLLTLISRQAARRIARHLVSARFSWASLKAHAGFAGHVAINTVLITVLSQTDRLFVSLLAPLHAVGAYGVVAMIAGAVVAFSYPFAIAALPEFTMGLARGNTQTVARVHARFQVAILVFVAPVCAVLFVDPYPMLVQYMGTHDGVPEMAAMLSPLGFFALMAAFVPVSYNVVVAAARLHVLRKINLVALASAAILIPVAIATGGARFIGWALAFAYGVQAVSLHFVVTRMCADKGASLRLAINLLLGIAGCFLFAFVAFRLLSPGLVLWLGLIICMMLIMAAVMMDKDWLRGLMRR